MTNGNIMLRWLVIGLGDIATKRVVPAILEEPRSELVGVVTRDAATADRYGVPGFASLDAALSSGDTALWTDWVTENAVAEQLRKTTGIQADAPSD